MATRQRLQVPDIGDRPHQPAFKFPNREFGKSKVVRRSFQPQWFKRWPWLHYKEDTDSVYCFVCVKAYSNNLLLSVGSLESTYISSGYTNWKDACVKFPNHELSKCHKDSVLKTVTLPATTRDVGESLSSQLAEDRRERRQCFLKIFSNVRFLARQALPLRGDGDECDSNYMQLLKLRGEDDARVYDWLKKKTDKYTSGEMQNEMMKVMAIQVSHLSILILMTFNKLNLYLSRHHCICIGTPRGNKKSSPSTLLHNNGRRNNRLI